MYTWRKTAPWPLAIHSCLLWPGWPACIHWVVISEGGRKKEKGSSWTPIHCYQGKPLIPCVLGREVLVAQLCPTLCNPMDCGPPGSSVHGILQARIQSGLLFTLQGLFLTQGPQVSCIASRFFTIWAIREARGEKRPFVFLKAFNIYSCLVYSEYVEGTGSSRKREDLNSKGANGAITDVKILLISFCLSIRTIIFLSPFFFVCFDSIFYHLYMSDTHIENGVRNRILNLIVLLRLWSKVCP